MLSPPPEINKGVENLTWRKVGVSKTPVADAITQREANKIANFFMSMNVTFLLFFFFSFC